MPKDLYTRVVFTVIAASLAVIAWKLPMTEIGHAQPGGGGCGGRFSPCYIELYYRGPTGDRHQPAIA